MADSGFGAELCLPSWSSHESYHSLCNTPRHLRAEVFFNKCYSEIHSSRNAGSGINIPRFDVHLFRNQNDFRVSVPKVLRRGPMSGRKPPVEQSRFRE